LSLMKLSREDARRLLLHSHGLNRVAPFGLGPEGTLEALRRTGYVQIDTISVVPRAHHHILWSRVPDYTPKMLHDLQVEAKLFEYWSHAAAYLPIESYRFGLPRMKRIRKTKHWFEKDKKAMRAILSRIKREGPLQARDFEAPTGHKSGNWFQWKPNKKALEALFHEGRLVIRERRGFQKVYDLPERYLPSDIASVCPTGKELMRHLIESSMNANGFTTARMAGYLRQIGKEITAELSAMFKRGDIVAVEIEGMKDPAFSTPAILARLGEASLDESRVKLLSPFDNMVIQRAPLKALFDFDYQIEVYVPAPKRKYGYFSLPILRGDRFLGRVDTKAD
ncbi:MAG: crosslink repair DNA glycosylase YcaQ family protein, partial [Bdellovibrionota bacterium]